MPNTVLNTAPITELNTWLNDIKARLAASQRPVCHITWQKTDQPALIGSRLGGPVYLPTGADYPMHQGQPLAFLAQINFAELPAMPSFPRTGLLQFFIAKDDLYGCDFNAGVQDPQSSFRLVYWRTPEDRADWVANCVVSDQDGYLPHDSQQCFAMQFAADTQFVGPNDEDFEHWMGAEVWDLPLPAALAAKIDPDDAHEALYEALSAMGSHVGGYPDFTQSDPRQKNSGLVLLLQLDSDDEANMMWGDCGIANFFIDPAHLAQADFSQVLYNWDCC